MEEPSQYELKCPIFLETDRVIQNTISKFWKASSKEKKDYTQDILLEIKVLLSCTNYNLGSSDCLNCHSILRKYLKEYKTNSFLSQVSSYQER